MAEENGRCLALTLRQAFLLERLSRDPNLEIPDLKNENITVFQRTKKRYQKWERTILDKGNFVDSKKISKKQERFILVSPFYSLDELVEIDPKPGSCYVFSASEPANEEAEIDTDKLTNWLNHYGLPQYHVHVSGHITPLQLRKKLEEIKPKKIFPVHCEKPELFNRFIGGLQSQTVLIRKNRKYVL